MGTWRDAGRIDTLDGWRGVAILLVLVNHVAFLTPFQNFFTQQGRTGVDIFFVISGYIITAGLLREGDALNLKAFYYRRAFRILLRSSPTSWFSPHSPPPD